MPALTPLLPVQTITTDVETVFVPMVKLGAMLNPSVSMFPHVVPLLTDVVTVLHSSLVSLGVQPPMPVKPSLLLVQAITTTVVTVYAHLVKPGVFLNPSVLLYQAVVLLMTTVVTV